MLKFTAILIVSLMAIVNALAAEAYTVKGTVTDAAGKATISAARVSVLNHQQSATTGDNGQFTLNINSGTAILKITAIGYAPRFFSVQGKSVLNIRLYPESFSAGLNPEQYQALNTTGEQENIPANSADEIIHDVFSGNVRAMTRSGASAMGAGLFIRGLNSINLNAQPLIVVDGIIRDNLYDVNSIHAGFFNNPLANIETGDIEKITVLRDGNSLYGSKGANGVILIDTKRGAGMVTKINANIFGGFTEAPQSYPVMGADDYRIYLTELLGSAGLSNQEILQLPYLNDDPSRSTYKRYHNDTDWSNSVYQSGFNSNYAISVNGGDEKALYYFSLGYTNNTGVVKNTDFQRYNMRLNADITLTDLLKTGLNIGFSRIDRNLLDDGVQDYSSPTWISHIKSPLLNPNTYTYTGELTSEIDFYDIFNIGNPLGIIEKSINTAKQSGFNFGIKPELKINDKFMLQGNFDYYLNKINEDYYRPYLYAAPVLIQGVGLSENARMSQVMRSNAINAEVRLQFAEKLAENTFLKSFIGSRVIYNNFESDYVEGHNSRSNSSINLKGSFKNLVTDGVNDVTKTISHFVSADLTHDSKYMLNATISMDGSSRFGRETKGGVHLFGQSWGIFPSIQGAWLVSAEEFMNNIDGINLLKLRAGYNITGNDQIPGYQNRAYFGSVKLSGISSGLVLSTLQNPEIQWENTSRANIGLDALLMNDRVNLAVDVYSSVTDNLLVMKSLPVLTGLNYFWKNEGTMANQGIEATINLKMINTKAFQWEVSASAGHYKNVITGLPNGSFVTKAFDGEILSAEGQSAGVFYGYKTLGVFSTDNDAQNAGLTMKNQEGIMVPFGAGDVIFEDVADENGVKDGIINNNDKQVIGNPNPDIYGSFTSKMTLGNLTFNALFTYSYGNDVYNYPRQLLESGKDYHNQSTAVLARWTAEGQTTTQPKAVFNDPMGNARFSDRWIEDGSYLKLKSLAVSYQVPVKLNFIEGINVWFSAGNIFTFSRYLGIDPEVSAGNGVLFQGIDAGLIPSTRNYTLGLKINL